jgi:hypothetical protein
VSTMRGVTLAEGAWPRVVRVQDGGHYQEEITGAGDFPACGLFPGELPLRQPGYQGSWA